MRLATSSWASLGEAQHALLVEQPIQTRVALPALTDEAWLQLFDFGDDGNSPFAMENEKHSIATIRNFVR